MIDVSFSMIENEGGKEMDDLMIFCDEITVSPGRRSTRELLVTLENPSEEDVLQWVDANVSIETLTERYNLKENL